MVNLFKISTFDFWQKWLFYSSLIFAFSGILFAFFGNSFFFQAYNQMLSKIFWNSNEFPKAPNEFRAFIYGPLGGTISCCYILLSFIAYYPFKEKKRWSQVCIIAAFGVWVIIDSLICLKFGVYPQIYLINLFSILIKGLPIFFTWKDF